MPAPTSGSSSAPTAIDFWGSGSALFAFRSLNISEDAYGDEDQMIRRRGNERVNNTILLWIVVDEYLGDSEGPVCFLEGYLLLALPYVFISEAVYTKSSNML